MLKVNPKFENLFAPLSPEEYAGLEQDIIATNGPREPIVIWNDTIIDGHHRYAICQKHDLPFTTREESFSSEAEAIAWMIKEQFNRRNMSPVARTIVALNAKEALIEIGRQKQNLRKDLADYVAEPHNTRKLIAEKAGVSDTFVYQVDYVLQHGEPKLKEAMTSEEMSVGQAYSIARKADEKLERKKQKREEARRAVTPIAAHPDYKHVDSGVEEQQIPSGWTELRRLSPEEQESIRRVAQFANMSPEKLARVKRLENEADEDTKAKLKRGEIEIDAAYEALVSTQATPPVNPAAPPAVEMDDAPELAAASAEDLTAAPAVELGTAPAAAQPEDEAEDEYGDIAPDRFRGMTICDCCNRHIPSEKVVKVKMNGKRGKRPVCPECAEFLFNHMNPQNRANYVKNRLSGHLDALLNRLDFLLDESDSLEMPASVVNAMIENIRETADEAIRTIRART